MNRKWLKLAGEFLDQAADILGNRGCNDWEWPIDWTEQERKEFVLCMMADNGTDLGKMTEDQKEDMGITSSMALLIGGWRGSSQRDLQRFRNRAYS